VSEVTHEAIKSENREDETIDDTLQRVLGIKPDVDDIERGIAAYLPDELREQVRELVEFINQIEDFETEIEEGGGAAGNDALKFISKDSGLTVAQIECWEDRYLLKYRDHEGELRQEINVLNAEDADMEEIKERTERKVKGAFRRWGER